MFEVFKQKIRKNLIGIFLTSVLFVVLIYIGVFAKDPYANYVLRGPSSVVTIYPGEDLSQYANKRVRCTFTYVGEHVVQFYDTYDSDETVYTCGYVGLDSTMQKPFCVFVPPSQKEQMDSLLNKTWEKKNGNSNKLIVDMITVEGYVRENDKKIYNFYVEALKRFYGEQYRVYNDKIYYIDCVDTDSGSVNSFTKWLIIGTVAITIITNVLCLIFSTFWKKRILEYMSQNNIARLDLELEFAKAKEVVPNYWISPQYTFYLGALSATIIKNDEIEKCYQFTQISGQYRVFYVGLETVQKKKYKSGAQKTTNDVQNVLQYYEANFPHIEKGKAVIKKY